MTVPCMQHPSIEGTLFYKKIPHTWTGLGLLTSLCQVPMVSKLVMAGIPLKAWYVLAWAYHFNFWHLHRPSSLNINTLVIRVAEGGHSMKEIIIANQINHIYMCPTILIYKSIPFWAHFLCLDLSSLLDLGIPGPKVWLWRKELNISWFEGVV